MYRLFSAREILNNYLTLIAPYLNQNSIINNDLAKQAYLNYLKKLQPYCPYMEDKQMFHAGEKVETEFENYFSAEERVPEAAIPYEPEIVQYADPMLRQKTLEAGFARAQEHDPKFAELFKLIMNTVFCTASKRLGGTSVNPRYIGVMCAYYDMTAEDEAVPELLIHEFTHNTLFLDELRYGYYSDYKQIYNPITYINAVYRGINIKLPFDRCLHSLVVSAEILLARDAYIGHKNRISQHLPSEKIVARAKNYIDQIKNNEAIDAIMTKRCREILDRLCERFD